MKVRGGQVAPITPSSWPVKQVDGVAHLIAQDMQDLSALPGGLVTASRDFH